MHIFIIKLIVMSIYRIFIIKNYEILFSSREHRGKHAENMFSMLHRDDIEYYRRSSRGTRVIRIIRQARWM